MKRQLHIRVDEIQLERWIRSRNIDNVNERLRMLIEADTELTMDEKARKELEKDIEEIDNEIRQLEKKRSYLVIQLKDMDAREDKEKEEIMQMRDWMADELQEMIARGR